MKKIVLSLVAIMAFGFANAQDVKFGAKLGFNFSTISSLEGAETKLGLAIGGLFGRRNRNSG